MTETWFRVTRLLTIEPVEVERWTDSCVWLANGRRVQRLNAYEEYLSTWERARARAIVRAGTDLHNARAAAKSAERLLAQVNKLPKEDPHGR